VRIELASANTQGEGITVQSGGPSSVFTAATADGGGGGTLGSSSNSATGTPWVLSAAFTDGTHCTL
jgi:hypothetical protein